MRQHGDPASKLSRGAFTDFLVQSPLKPVEAAEDAAAPPCGYGSFHQQYWLDGARGRRRGCGARSSWAPAPFTPCLPCSASPHRLSSPLPHALRPASP
jgi:hypothetical protein